MSSASEKQIQKLQDRVRFWETKVVQESTPDNQLHLKNAKEDLAKWTTAYTRLSKL